MCSIASLNWFSCVVSAISQRTFISFSKFCKQLNRTHSIDVNPSVKTSVLSETDESFKLPLSCFLLDSILSSELLFKSLFAFEKICYILTHNEFDNNITILL